MSSIETSDLIDLSGIAQKSGQKRGTIGKWYQRGKIRAVRSDLRVGPIFSWSEVSATIASWGSSDGGDDA